jgi:single-stranded-DNA-specific exonuclease
MTMGSENKHLRLKVIEPKLGYKPYEAVAFNFGEYSSKIRPGNPIKLAYNLDINEWNGKKKLQLKIRDIKV